MPKKRERISKTTQKAQTKSKQMILDKSVKKHPIDYLLVDLPLIRRPIIATFTISVFKLERNLQNFFLR